KGALPRLIAEHVGGLRAWPSFVRQKATAEYRPQPHHVGEVHAGFGGKDALGFAAPGEIEAILGRSVCRREASEGTRLALPVEEIQGRDADLFVAVRPVGF